MTIDEIKSVSIVQYLESEGIYSVSYHKGNYWYISPFRTESSPSFNVSFIKNLWHDFGTGEGGNIINLVQKFHPTWNNHQVLSYIEGKIVEHKLVCAADYKLQIKDYDEIKLSNVKINVGTETHIDSIIEINHPYLRDYILKRCIDFEIAKKYCNEIHYSIYGKHYYAIAFKNIDGGFEVRNKYCKRSIGRKSISILSPNGKSNKDCCIFEGFFDMLAYETIRKHKTNLQICIGHECDYIVLNSVNNIRILFDYLQNYNSIHCYLDNDNAGSKATATIKSLYANKTIDESFRYASYKDINDIINGSLK